MIFYGFDTTYLVFILPCVILSLVCQIAVKSTFSKYSAVRNSRNMTGAQAAEYVLRQNGVTGVRIEHVSGSLTDHFDPRTNVIRLSDTVYNSAFRSGGRCSRSRGRPRSSARTKLLPEQAQERNSPCGAFGFVAELDFHNHRSYLLRKGRHGYALYRNYPLFGFGAVHGCNAPR